MPRTPVPMADLDHPSWYAVKRGCTCATCIAFRKSYNTAYVRERRAAIKAGTWQGRAGRATTKE